MGFSPHLFLNLCFILLPNTQFLKVINLSPQCSPSGFWQLCLSNEHSQVNPSPGNDSNWGQSSIANSMRWLLVCSCEILLRFWHLLRWIKRIFGKKSSRKIVRELQLASRQLFKEILMGHGNIHKWAWNNFQEFKRRCVHAANDELITVTNK